MRINVERLDGRTTGRKTPTCPTRLGEGDTSRSTCSKTKNTRADAVLRTDGGAERRHAGVARRSPRDRDVPEIGDEQAACRALSGLAHDLLEATATDVQENDPASHKPVVSLE